MSHLKVGIIMGSKSDLSVMSEAAKILEKLGLSSEVSIVSAHRTPMQMVEYAQSARLRGLKVIIAGAGGAAHLPGMVASLTSLPVIGVPIKSKNSLDGWDSVLSILHAGGAPATVALDGQKMLHFSCRDYRSFDKEVAKRLDAHKKSLEQAVLNHDKP